MKRRNFLSLSAAGVGLASLGPAGGVNGGRLYGSPLYENSPARSLGENQLRLALSRMEMPVEAWEPVMKMSRLWTAVMRNDKTREEFRLSPRRFLVRNGIPPGVMRRSSQEFRLLQLICDPYIRHLAGAGNYRAFIGRLKERNAFHDDAEDSLRKRVRRLLEADVERLRTQLVGATGQIESSDLQNSADLYFVTRELAAANSTTQAVAAAAVVVVVAALAATYVSVGVNVTVVLNLGFSISVAVSVSVGIGGVGGGDNGGCSNCHADVGALASLEPKMRENLDLTIRAARLTGQPSFETQALRDYIFTETRACLEAAESLAVINLPGERGARESLLKGVARLTCRAAGLVP